MDRSKHLILIKGEDRTEDIKICVYNPSTQKYDVTFKNSGKIYPYRYDSIEWVKNPEEQNCVNVHIEYGGRELFQIQTIFIFHAKATDYWFIRLSNGNEKTYNSQDLNISYSCLVENEVQYCINYLHELASVNDLKGDDGEILLQR